MPSYAGPSARPSSTSQEPAFSWCDAATRVLENGGGPAEEWNNAANGQNCMCVRKMEDVALEAAAGYVPCETEGTGPAGLAGLAHVIFLGESWAVTNQSLASGSWISLSGREPCLPPCHPACAYRLLTFRPQPPTSTNSNPPSIIQPTATTSTAHGLEQRGTHLWFLQTQPGITPHFNSSDIKPGGVVVGAQTPRLPRWVPYSLFRCWPCPAQAL